MRISLSSWKRQENTNNNNNNSAFRDHTSPIFRSLNLLKIQDIHKFSILVHMHKKFNDNNFRVSHSINTRNRNLANPVFHRLTVTQQAVSFKGPLYWNNLPVNLREIKSLPAFKFHLKKYLISQY